MTAFPLVTIVKQAYYTEMDGHVKLGFIGVAVRL